MRSALFTAFVGSALLLAGCAGQPMPRTDYKTERKAEAPGGGEVAKGGANQRPDAIRKIIYTATVQILTDNFVEAEKQLLQSLSEFKAYVIHSDVSGTVGDSRRGEWKIRVPTDQFEAFRATLTKLGTLERSTIDSQDVTDEFFDLQTRIKNRLADEESIRKMYEKAQGKMEDILAVRRELQNIRLEIEREQGRLQMLTKLTEMTTVTVILHERGVYIPPEAESFPKTLGRTFTDSLANLVTFGQGLVLFVVALVPWLPVFALFVFAFVVLRRRWTKKTPATAT